MDYPSHMLQHHVLNWKSDEPQKQWPYAHGDAVLPNYHHYCRSDSCVLSQASFVDQADPTSFLHLNPEEQHQTF